MVSSGTPTPHELDPYFLSLEEFKETCLALISAGQAYHAVILCHELYRFLYPVEPYADFVNSDPATFLRKHIKKLTALGISFNEIVCGYETPPHDGRLDKIGSDVEQSTTDLYSSLWRRFGRETLAKESAALLLKRLPSYLIENYLRDQTVLDMGCGSGRYSIAIAGLGAKSVTAVDYSSVSFEAAASYSAEVGLPIEFIEANVLSLPFDDRQFDFVFSNGVLHHTTDWKKALGEYFRVMGRAGFLYLYGSGGFFWTTRKIVREIFEKIPRTYTKSILDIIGLPENRFIFMDTWYVPVEEHIRREDLLHEFDRHNVEHERLRSSVEFDPDYALKTQVKDAQLVWGEGEHRYFLTKETRSA